MKQEFKFKSQEGRSYTVTIDPEEGSLEFNSSGVGLSLEKLENFFTGGDLREYGHAVIDMVMAYNTLLGSYADKEGPLEVASDMTPNPDYSTPLRKLIYFLNEVDIRVKG